MSDLLRHSTSAAVWSFLDKWILRLLSTVVFIFLGRLVAPADFGVVAGASVITGLLLVLVDRSFGKSIVRAPSIDDRQLDTAFWSTLAIGCLLAAVTAGAAPLLGRLFDEPRTVPILRVLSLVFVLKGLDSTQIALMQRALAFRSLALRRLASSLVGGVVGIGAAFAGFGAWALVLQLLVQESLGVVVLWRLSTWRPGIQVDRVVLGEQVRFGGSVVGSELLGIVNKNADNLLVGVALGSSALGVYTVAYRFLLVMLDTTVSAFSNVALPAFARVQGEMAALRRAIFGATRLSSLVAIPLFVGMAVCAEPMVLAALGRRWIEAVPVVRGLCPVGVVYSVAYFDRPALLALGRSGLAFRLALGATVCNLVAFVIGVRFGLVGLAWSFSVAVYAYWPVRLWVLRRVIGIGILDYFGRLVAPLVASAVMAGAVLAVLAALDGAPEIVLLGAGAGVGLVAYVAAMAVVGRDRIVEVWTLIRPLLRRRPSPAVA